MENLAGQGSGLIAEEVGGEVRDFLGGGDAFEGMAVSGRLALGFVVEEGRREWGIGEGRCDGVDANFWRPFGGEGAGEAFESALGHGDGGVKWHTGLDGNCGEEENGGGGGFLEVGEGLLEDVDGSEGVDLVIRLEVFGGEAMEGLQVDGAGEVGESIQGFGEFEFCWGGGVEVLDGNAKGLELIL